MKQYVFIILATILLVPMKLYGQDYKALWSQVEEAQSKDLPKTALTHLQTIENWAYSERNYGQLLKAALLHSKLQAEIAPDSLQPAVARLEQLEQSATDIALKAVYDVVLSQLYRDFPQLDEDGDDRSSVYRRQAMEHPEVLAQIKADAYVPFIVKYTDSSLFDNDLLSIIGYELDAWQWLNDYYRQTDNRRAAFVTALNATEDIEHIDSLIEAYGDLPEACEAAIKRYQKMGDSYSAADKSAWLIQSIDRWGKTWKRSNSLRNSLASLTNPSYSSRLDLSVTEVNKPQTVQLFNLRNLESLTLRVYRTSLAGDTDLRPNYDKDYQKMKSGLKEVTAYTQTFSGHADYEIFKDSILLEGLPAGVYLLEFSTQPQTEVKRTLYFVSGIRSLIQPQPDNTTRYIAVDATTGQPLPGATVRLSFSKGWNEPKEVVKLTCNQDGEVFYTPKEQKTPEVFVYTDNDNYCPEINSHGSYSYYARSYYQERTSLFTDRAIYRPGQTVYASAIVWKEQSALENAAVADKAVIFELFDANRKLVSEQRATTDRFGKCSVIFTLPNGKLNGHFSIRANSSSTSFRVEEYKRPTFQVEFPEYKEPYQQGDTVHAQAKATTYAGVPVQGAKVKYSVRRRVAYWWSLYSWYWQTAYYGSGLEDEVVKEGETVADDNGMFTVDMPMLLPDDAKRHTMFYNFVVEADVTDTAGETHFGLMSLPLGSKPTALTCNIPQKVRSDELPQVTFNRRNAAGKEIEGTVKYRLDGGKWKECAANKALAILNASIKSGEHQLEAVCQKDSVNLRFIVFGLDDKKPAMKTHDWYYISEQQFPADGSPVTIQVGSSDPDLHIVYSIFSGSKVIESGAVKKNGELINRKLTYREDYGNGLLVTYAWVKDGQCYSHKSLITRPLPDYHLKVKWQTFRDRLTPGQQEEWKLSIKNPDDTPADASLMAVLYDKSLDALTSHNWHFSPGIYLPQPSTSWQWQTWSRIQCSGAQDYSTQYVPSSYYFSRFDHNVYPERYNPFRHVLLRSVYKEARVVEERAMPMAVENEAAREVMVRGTTVKDDAAEQKQAPEVPQEADSTESGVTIRENLNETAFCYAALETDPQGDVVVTFTLPESLTTWKFMGIANTPDMLYGSISGEAIAQKEVMIQPNIPRFIRMGDDAQVSARIFNISEKDINGTASLQLVNPETDKVVYEQTQPFTVEAGKTGAATFSIQPSTFNESLLICRVIASGDGFSDGEQHYLPILPNQEYVTKTVAYTQHEAGVKSIDLNSLFPAGTTQQKLTVEYTNNPAWLMVQSLPVLGQPWEDSAIDQAASFYSNLLAKHLLKQSPQVKGVFEQWKREEQSGDLSSLTSQLSKNQELKDLILEETPWVNAADRDTEQKHRLADFFDENGINNRLNTAVEKLKKLQNRDGSFSWYPGMNGSTYITVAIEEMLARLNVLTGSENETSRMQKKAFDFIGKEMVEIVKEMKKQEKKGYKPVFPSFTALRWLYICAIDGRNLSSSVKSANDYLIKLLKKEIKHQTIYEKALTAVILAKHKEGKKAAEYVQSLKEYTVFTEEMGRYYDTRRATYSWYDYKIPTEVAAMEAIQIVSPQDKQTVDEMRRWLLQEKRTQAWSTPINSVNAIYAFLNSEPSSLDNQGEATVLAVDGSPIDMPKATVGIGYVKTAINEPKGSTFTATKTSNGTSWGAVYAQFLQNTSEIEAAGSGITVKREVMIAGKPQSTGTVKVGDRIRIRITIETTRDIDFVQVVDRRAACMEPVKQLSGYHNGAYCVPKDYATHYFYGGLAKGKHVIETEYYIDRAGQYETGTCTVGCAYSPEFRATAPSITLNIE